MTVMVAKADPQKYWKMMCDKYPRLRMVDIFLRRAPDIAQRYGHVYCKSEWLLGPEQSVSTPNAVSIPDAGVERAVNFISESEGITHPRLVMSVVRILMPQCMHQGCVPHCRGGFMQMSTARQYEAS